MNQDPLIGQQLGNFRIDRLIGRGGMARVYCGWDVKLERPVAVKVIEARYRSLPGYAARFVREARAVATWRHENIVQIYYADEYEGHYYFVMEYIDGLDLGELMAQYADEGELMPHEDVLRLGRAIASALDYAHEKGMIHRDVKPSNVLVASDGRVVLTDFGLALDVQQGTRGQVLGSPHYVAPEQARSSANAVPQSDLYSLGVLMYELLTGSVPFDDSSSIAVAIQHITCPPPPPREVNPRLSREVGAVLLKALSKSPKERYQSGQELLDALGEALQASPLDALLAELPPLSVGAALPGGRALSTVTVGDRVTSHLRADAGPAPDAAAPVEQDDRLLGQQIDEYRLDALLGRGAMARIYQGLDVRLNRQVAIKVIDAPFRADPDHLVRFEQEAQAIARLEHPNIVRLYRYGEAQGLLYMAMQYVEGEDLGTVLARCRKEGSLIDLEDARHIVGQVCAALDCAHSHGVIHRDVRPANIMLRQDGQAILTDFGLALLVEAGTRGMVLGSPHYVAPEQVQSSANVVPQSDLYAVGVILYEMFTGEVPFDAENPLDVAVKHVTEAPRPPRELRPDMPPELERVILKAMAREPQDRYASGEELVAALDQALLKVPLQLPVTVSPFPTPRFDPDVSTIPPPEALVSPTVEPRAASPKRPKRRRAGLPLEESPREPGSAGLSPRDKQIILYAGIGLVIMLFCIVGLVVAVPLLRGIIGVAGQTPTVAARRTEATDLGDLPTGTAETTPAPPTGTAETTPAPPTGIAQTTPTPTTRPPTATPQGSLPPSYDLRIYTRDKESLFLVNEGEEDFPLALLRLGNERGEVLGTDWGIDVLEPGLCVAVWTDKDNPRPPEDADCNLVGARLVVREGDRFWREDFAVYYDGEELATCRRRPKQCSIRSESDDEDD